jgi:hypothetical protein
MKRLTLILSIALFALSFTALIAQGQTVRTVKLHPLFNQTPHLESMTLCYLDGSKYRSYDNCETSIRVKSNKTPSTSSLFDKLNPGRTIRFTQLDGSHYVSKDGAKTFWKSGDAIGSAASVQSHKLSNLVINGIYPNPVNDNSQISYTIPSSGGVRVSILDIKGNRLLSLIDKVQDVGDYHLFFSTKELANGVYICRLEQGSNSVIQKIVITH